MNNPDANHDEREVPLSGIENSSFDKISIGCPLKGCYIIAYHDDEKILKGANNVRVKSPLKPPNLEGPSPTRGVRPH